MVEGAVPLGGVTVSHGWSVAAVQFSVPPPVLLTEIDCDGGLEPPETAANVRLPGEVARTGVAGLTVNVTGIVLGEPLTPAADTVTLPVYVPAARLPVAAVTVTVPG